MTDRVCARLGVLIDDVKEMARPGVTKKLL